MLEVYHVYRTNSFPISDYKISLMRIAIAKFEILFFKLSSVVLYALSFM